jgi:8-oxo-dGTP pyrophosphatase MutT (NUDIX family)
MGATKLQLVDSAVRTRHARDKEHSPRSRQPEKPQTREQVAAVCYRLRNTRVQFLLVRTRKGRWTFPKGCIEPGSTYAQSAALEAFEEAGVHGRLEEVCFARYILRKRGKLRQNDTIEVVTQCHLCEVLRLESPQELNRNPTWFYPEKAKLCLKEDRKPDNGDELTRIVDRAVNRVQRLRNGVGWHEDALRRIEFEASEIKMHRLMASAALADYIRSKKGILEPPAALRLGFNTVRRRLLRLGPAPPSSSPNLKS